jgi:histidinol-phosphate/aromatic aminotransferase/cobyric acid decarboxylase-like protein/choline kinase
MQAIILAAGMGKRLGKMTESDTKCMIEVNEAKLIDRMISSLEYANIKDICIVIGYKGDRVKSHIHSKWNNLNISFIENAEYDKTNNIYSLLLAKDILSKDDTILLESDLIFDKDLIKKIAEDSRETLAVVDRYQDWMDGTVVSFDNEGFINSFVSKKEQDSINIKDYYKTVNIYKFSKNFLNNTYIPFLESYCKSVGVNEYYESVLNIVTKLNEKELYAFDIKPYKWYEIDDINDHKNATTIFSDKENLFREYSSRYGGYWRFPELVDYCYLVNPYFPSSRFKKSLMLDFDKLLTEYPSGLEVLNGLAGNLFKINSDYIVVGNGASELISVLARDINNKTIGLFVPSFDEYSRQFKNNKQVIVNTFNMSESEWKDSILFLSRSCDYVVVVNPDNPTGKFLEINQIINILDLTKNSNCKIIIDESFVDFSDNGDKNSIINEETLEKYKNLIVIKSISKSFGVAGIRLGVMASSDKDLLKKIKENFPVWNINSFAESFLQKITYNLSDYRKSCSKLLETKKDFQNNLSSLGIKVYNSQANFFMIELPSYTSSKDFADHMIKNNILVKVLDGKSGIPEGNFLRLSIKSEDQNKAFVYLAKEYFDGLKK